MMLWLLVVGLPAAPAHVTGRRELRSCGSATFVAKSTCSFNSRNCYDDVPCGGTCEGDGECGTSWSLNNCGIDDVYERFCDSPTPRPTLHHPTPLPTTQRPTPQPTINNVMTDSNIRTAVAAWLADPTAAEATYRHISTWRTGEVTDMASLFCGSSSTASWATDCNSAAASFNEDISAWDTSGVRTMYLMFHSASSFNRPLGNWRVDKVTDMSWMFSGASAFDQDLGWCVEDDVDLRHSFENTPCASTSCGVDVQGASCPHPTPRPTPAPTTPPTPAPTTPAPTTPAPTPTPIVDAAHRLAGAGAALLALALAA